MQTNAPNKDCSFGAEPSSLIELDQIASRSEWEGMELETIQKLSTSIYKDVSIIPNTVAIGRTADERLALAVVIGLTLGYIATCIKTSVTHVHQIAFAVTLIIFWMIYNTHGNRKHIDERSSPAEPRVDPSNDEPA